MHLASRGAAAITPEYNGRMIDTDELYLAKAQASLAGAQSEPEQR
jgi:hypothetical protein